MMGYKIWSKREEESKIIWKNRDEVGTERNRVQSIDLLQFSTKYNNIISGKHMFAKNCVTRQGIFLCHPAYNKHKYSYAEIGSLGNLGQILNIGSQISWR